MWKDRVSNETHSPPKAKVKATSWPVASPRWWHRSHRARSPPVSLEASLTRGQVSTGQLASASWPQAPHPHRTGRRSHRAARGLGVTKIDFIFQIRKLPPRKLSSLSLQTQGENTPCFPCQRGFPACPVEPMSTLTVHKPFFSTCRHETLTKLC